MAARGEECSMADGLQLDQKADVVQFSGKATGTDGTKAIKSGPSHRCLSSTRSYKLRFKKKVSTHVSTFAISTLWVPTIAVTTSPEKKNLGPRP